MKKLVFLYLVFLFALCFCGCKEKNNTASEQSATNNQIETNGISISDSELTLNVGETKPLLATADNKNNIVWKSSDEHIAKYFDGEVLGKNIGTCTITASLPSGEKSACLITVNAKTIDSGICGENVNWIYYEDGTLEILGNGEMKEYYNAYQLSADVNKNRESIPWERYNQTIKNIKINEGITKICRYAFFGATNALSVNISSTVKTIEYGAFSKINSAKIIIPKTVQEIGAGVLRFSKCNVYFEFDENYLSGIENNKVEQYSPGSPTSIMTNISWNSSFEGKHYFYSETQKDGCWHYVDEEPTLW